MSEVVFFFAAFLAALLFVRVMLPVAERMGIVDHPSGHKAHKLPVPYVGGFGLVAAFLLFGLFAALGHGAVDLAYLASLMVCGLAMFVVGLVDDRWQISFRIRLVIEALAVLVMVAGAGVVLNSFGELLPGVTISLGVLAIPVTVFCILGVTNALNMIDGIDGLSGSVSLISLLALGLMAYVGGHESGMLLALALAGGMAGFLFFNFRFGRQRTARVYLGDNGSTVLGFLMGWLFVELSQGQAAVIAPVTALYLFALPLFDSVMAIIRRLWLGRSPFKPDRSHLHHMLLDAGASVETTVWLMAGLHLVMASVGIVAYYAGLSEALMFWLFIGLFLSYGYVISRPWRFVPRMRRIMTRLGITLEHGTGVFVGRFDRSLLPAVLSGIRSALGSDASVRVYAEQDPENPDREKLFAVIELGSWRMVRATVNRLRRSLSMVSTFEIRQYVTRRSENDSRSEHKPVFRDRRRMARRGSRHIQELVEYRINTPGSTQGVSHQPIAA